MELLNHLNREELNKACNNAYFNLLKEDDDSMDVALQSTRSHFEPNLIVFCPNNTSCKSRIHEDSVLIQNQTIDSRLPIPHNRRSDKLNKACYKCYIILLKEDDITDNYTEKCSSGGYI
ncbi:hypothetical protein M9Y10_011031 [Tritrichomonas musculus]|uniref:Uncharacterized protein n=1 Tax=Tritrichomonas musculus TaxID=1915356 RepID=A0ABR2INV8_9EUKA